MRLLARPWATAIDTPITPNAIQAYGAIFFHLFTPLGVAVVNTDGSSDGGELFLLACGVWLACLR